MLTSYPCTGPDCSKSRPLPCGTPSTTSTKTTSASSFSAIRNPQLAPTLPAPTTVTFFRKRKAPLEWEWKEDYSSGWGGGSASKWAERCGACGQSGDGKWLRFPDGKTRLPAPKRD